jgi:soluble cytochrome b562
LGTRTLVEASHSQEVVVSSLQDVRHALLALHRTMLEAERQEYERMHGRQSAGQFLDAIIHAPELAWLQPLTALIVRLDEELEDVSAGALRAGSDSVQQLRTLLRPDPSGAAFQRRYADLLQRSAEVVMAHGALVRMLPA